MKTILITLMVIVDVYDLFMVVRAHLKITFKDKDGFNLGS